MYENVTIRTRYLPAYQTLTHRMHKNVTPARRLLHYYSTCFKIAMKFPGPKKIAII